MYISVQNCKKNWHKTVPNFCNAICNELWWSFLENLAKKVLKEFCNIIFHFSFFMSKSCEILHPKDAGTFCKGRKTMEWCNCHLIPHFEECSNVVQFSLFGWFWFCYLGQYSGTQIAGSEFWIKKIQDSKSELDLTSNSEPRIEL